jgi:hypothetical protein
MSYRLLFTPVICLKNSHLTADIKKKKQWVRLKNPVTVRRKNEKDELKPSPSLLLVEVG